jgi:rhodanese-related sulfurtransferase
MNFFTQSLNKMANNIIVVDVRTAEEFVGGHVAGSINIPLQEVVSRAEEIMNLPQPIIFCCVSGNRSGQAMHYFRSLGVDCENGGSWLEVKAQLK